MELAQNIKDKIESYIQNHSEAEVKKAFEQIGLSFDDTEKELDYDELTLCDALKKLHKEIKEYGEYLEQSSYHPYNRVQDFERILDKIIEKHWPYEL
jgi:hypothetical protein